MKIKKSERHIKVCHKKKNLNLKIINTVQKQLNLKIKQTIKKKKKIYADSLKNDHKEFIKKQ